MVSIWKAKLIVYQTAEIHVKVRDMLHQIQRALTKGEVARIFEMTARASGQAVVTPRTARRFEGVWSGIAVDKPGEGTSKDPLTIRLSTSPTGQLTGQAAGRFVARGFTELHDIQVKGDQLSFIVIHRIGMRMQITLKLIDHELHGEGIPIDIDEDRCDITLSRVREETGKMSPKAEQFIGG